MLSLFTCSLVVLLGFTGPNGCFDEATDCQKRKEEGKCLTEPEDMMKSCSDTCNMCFREQRTFDLELCDSVYL